MASIEFINKRIQGKKAEIIKLEKKLERIMKAQASNWTDNPYFYSERDIKWTTRDIEEARQALAKYEAELIVETEKGASRNVKAIVDFLEGWKNRVREYYRIGLEEYYTTRETLKRMYKAVQACRWGTPEYEMAEAEYKKAWAEFKQKCNGYYEDVEEVNRLGKKVIRQRKVKDGELEYLKPYNEESTLEEAMKKLEKELTEEANRKYDFIIERVNAICGKIIDANGLTIGAKGDLNGIIKGERGNAKVQTIGAGGYNIQCYHFRTLIHEAK